MQLRIDLPADEAGFACALLAPFGGQVLRLAAVSYDSATLTGRLSSIARPIRIVP